ncbi:MAG TPA: lipoprotein insertase outer membrane protein LolB [Fluviicoccus sp.]|nr:lipoprotein insertase outer membrane protein LolB [Fluviicoccus sp.]
MPPLPDAGTATPLDLVSKPGHLLIWTASGKIAIRVLQSDGRESAATAYYVWQQHGNMYRITLNGPLGQGRTVLEGSPEKVTLDSARTGHVEAASPEELMQQALGWTAPVSLLPKWFQGKAATPGAEAVMDDAGLPKSLLEENWQADYKSWITVNNEVLPEKFVITGPNTRLTVLVSQWQTR